MKHSPLVAARVTFLAACFACASSAQMHCNYVPSVTNLRAEGVTEALADQTFQCAPTGSVPSGSGYVLSVFSPNAPITSDPGPSGIDGEVTASLVNPANPTVPFAAVTANSVYQTGISFPPLDFSTAPAAFILVIHGLRVNATALTPDSTASPGVRLVVLAVPQTPSTPTGLFGNGVPIADLPNVAYAVTSLAGSVTFGGRSTPACSNPPATDIEETPGTQPAAYTVTFSELVPTDFAANGPLGARLAVSLSAIPSGMNLYVLPSLTITSAVSASLLSGVDAFGAGGTALPAGRAYSRVAVSGGSTLVVYQLSGPLPTDKNYAVSIPFYVTYSARLAAGAALSSAFAGGYAPFPAITTSSHANPIPRFGTPGPLAPGSSCIPLVTPPAPWLSAPFNGAQAFNSPYTLYWFSSLGATSYDVYFGTSSNPPLIGSVTGLSYTTGQLNPNATYYWRIAARNAAGATSSTTWTLTTAQIPGPFSLTSPANGSTGIPLDPTLSWTASSNAIGYSVYLGTTNPPPLLSYGAYSNSASATGVLINPLTPLAPSTLYYWQVLAFNNTMSARSAVWEFTTLAIPVLRYPLNGGSTTKSGPTLSWNAVPGAATYCLAIGPTSPPPLTVTGLTTASYTPPQLSPHTTYYWQVATDAACSRPLGASLGPSRSAVWSFTTYPAAWNIGVYSSGAFMLDSNGNFQWDGTPSDKQISWTMGQPGEIPVYGDWNGDGRTKAGLYVNGLWVLDYNGNGVWDGPAIDKMVHFGLSGATPVVGDWNGSGTTKIGVYAGGAWLLDYNGNFQWDGAPTDVLAYFGGPGYAPVVGDWSGSGTTKIGAYQAGVWLLDVNGNFQWDGAPADMVAVLGSSGYTPVLGDWTGDGKTKIGAFNSGNWLLDINGNGVWDGATDKVVSFGAPGSTPVVGDWNLSGTSKIGVFLDGEWILDVNGSYSWDGPTVDKMFSFGGAGAIPLVGNW